MNILTGFRDELAPWLAGHMDVNAIDLTGVTGRTAELERLAAENVKRVVRSSADQQSPSEIQAFLEFKTVGTRSVSDAPVLAGDPCPEWRAARGDQSLVA